VRLRMRLYVQPPRIGLCAMVNDVVSLVDRTRSDRVTVYARDSGTRQFGSALPMGEHHHEVSMSVRHVVPSVVCPHD
jgi:hypothetical protein